jgi:hypothetical protein
LLLYTVLKDTLVVAAPIPMKRGLSSSKSKKPPRPKSRLSKLSAPKKKKIDTFDDSDGSEDEVPKAKKAAVKNEADSEDEDELPKVKKVVGKKPSPKSARASKSKSAPKKVGVRTVCPKNQNSEYIF